MVQCNFSRPDLEAQWNEWYNGPKLLEMLSKPLFLSGQRYRAAGFDQTFKYLALWVVKSPDAFTTPEYRSSWGFFHWAPYIVDWSRNLYRGPEGDLSPMCDVPPEGALYFLSLDGVPEADAKARRRTLEAMRPELLWMKAVGLDRSCPVIGLQRIPDANLTPSPLSPQLATGIRETIYRPISERRRAA